MAAVAAAIAAIAAIGAAGVRRASAAPVAGSFGPGNPFVAAGGASTMHADAESSGASRDPGPGAGAVTQVNTLAAACPTVLQGSDGFPVALCTAIVGRHPVVYLLNPATGAALASLSLPAGNLFGGVYAYLDRRNRIVLFDALGNLLRIGHGNVSGHWQVTVAQRVSAAAAIDTRCPSLCGGVVGVTPDWQGRVWFATAGGVAGFVDPATGVVRTLALGAHEQVANSISSSPVGVAVATDHALYLADVARNGQPRVLWRHAYDRGPARKPGQLSHGTGSTPVFFGGSNGARYLAFTDNATPAEHLIVLDTAVAKTRVRGRSRTGRRTPAQPSVACRIPVLTPGPSGTENAPVAFGASVYVASTYGYPYPAYPAGAEPSVPATAPFTGGVTRVDLNPSGRGCHVVWQSGVRSAAVPRLDVPDRLLYTVRRTDPLDPTGTSSLDSFTLVALDISSGVAAFSTPLGVGPPSDTLQLSPTIVPGGVLYQGTISGVDRVAARRENRR